MGKRGVNIKESIDKKAKIPTTPNVKRMAGLKPVRSMPNMNPKKIKVK